MKQCPICDYVDSRFDTGGFDLQRLESLKVIGGGRRNNAICPGCGSSDRERLVYLYLVHQAEVFDHGAEHLTVLHVAPERRLRSIFGERSNMTYITADLYRSDVDARIDICEIPESNETYDVIICNHVLEHVDDDRRAMRELFRVMKHGGFGVFQVPISPTIEGTFEDPEADTPEQRLRLFGQPDHVRIYGPDYADRLAEAGFAVERFSWKRNRRRFGGLWNRYALIRDELLHVARKAAPAN